MLGVYQKISEKIEQAERKENMLFFGSKAFSYRIMPVNSGVLRITVTKGKDFSAVPKPGVLPFDVYKEWELEENEEFLWVKTKDLVLRIQKETGSFTYLNTEGEILLKERDRCSKELEEFTAYRLVEGGAVEKEIVETADGRKEIIRSADKEEAGKLFHTRVHYQWQEGEELLGLGQQEEGKLSLRGRTVYVHQANRKIAIPFLVSGRGYGLLTDTYSPMIFRDDSFGSYLYTEADMELDYYFLYGQTMPECIRLYRELTGAAELLPKWAYGYVQSQERYETARELLDTVSEYRKRGLGLDGIVLDWCSWEDGMWGQKSLDPKRFENPKEWMESLHKQGVRFMLSIWPNMDPHCKDYKEFEEKGLLLPGSNIYNPFEKAGRELYWQQVEKNLFCHGIDAWWCDNSEPYTPEWNHMVRQEPDTMYHEYVKETQNHMDAWRTNSFAFYHAQSLYEGQRSVSEEKRVFNLTRSAYTGQQRFGTVLWSGDISASWDTFRKQIAEGLSFSASGMPYWTADTGAFFVRTGEQWYWNGDYPKADLDLGYQELYVRWYQWCCFLPLFRCHGTDCRRELYQYGKEVPAFYEALKATNALRYRLLPFLYSVAYKVWKEGASFMEPLAFRFPEDEKAVKIWNQYLFGEQLLVCPVTTPMYYDKDSKVLNGVQKTQRVYLPKGTDWYDFWTDKSYAGGQEVEANADISKPILFVKAGTILPLAEFEEPTSAYKQVRISVYPGQDAVFDYYEDAGDGYGYQRGEYTLRRLTWEEKAGKFAETVLVDGGSLETRMNLQKVVNIAMQKPVK